MFNLNRKHSACLLSGFLMACQPAAQLSSKWQRHYLSLQVWQEAYPPARPSTSLASSLWLDGAVN